MTECHCTAWWRKTTCSELSRCVRYKTSRSAVGEVSMWTFGVDMTLAAAGRCCGREKRSLSVDFTDCQQSATVAMECYGWMVVATCLEWVQATFALSTLECRSTSAMWPTSLTGRLHHLSLRPSCVQLRSTHRLNRC